MITLIFITVPCSHFPLHFVLKRVCTFACASISFLADIHALYRVGNLGLGGACAKYRKQLGTWFSWKTHCVPRAGIKCHSETSERLFVFEERSHTCALFGVKDPRSRRGLKRPVRNSRNCRELLTLFPSKVSEQTCSRTCQGLTDAFGVRLVGTRVNGHKQ